MAQGPPTPSWPAGATASVRLVVRLGPARTTTYDVGEDGFLIGTVPGCDLRLPGTDLSPVICLISRGPTGASLRKLVPTQPLLLNGSAFSSGPLHNGDRVSLGSVEIGIQAVESVADPLQGRLQQLEERERQLAEQI